MMKLASTLVTALVCMAPVGPTMASNTHEFRLAFGSCSKVDRPQPMWPIIASRKPDVFLWLGDAIYADVPVLGPVRLPASISRIQDHYRRQLAIPAYQDFAASTPIIGVWYASRHVFTILIVSRDDHDYGANDGDKRYALRDESQKEFLDFIGEPINSPRRNQSGTWTSHRYSVDGFTIRVILLDVRYARDPWMGGVDMLGDEQWSWLSKELHDNTANVTLIGM